MSQQQQLEDEERRRMDDFIEEVRRDDAPMADWMEANRHKGELYLITNRPCRITFRDPAICDDQGMTPWGEDIAYGNKQIARQQLARYEASQRQGRKP